MSWLRETASKPDTSGSYPAFYETVEAIVMGWTTYHQIVTALSRTSGPHEGRPCYVVTHRQGEKSGECLLLEWGTDRPGRSAKNGVEGKRLDLRRCVQARQLLKENRIDKLWLSVIPTVLGKGVAVSGLHRELPLKPYGNRTLQRNRGSGLRKAVTSVEIRRVETNKKQYLALLLLADEQEDMIDRYLERRSMYVLEDDGVKGGVS